jgi:EAL domain-containing protein (putative c-di-GMP-specific phosphodiesterase class I)
VIPDIDRWVIRMAAGLAAAGHAVEINLSAETLADPTMFRYLERALREAGAPPRLLVVELTETAVLQDESAARFFTDQLRRLGCAFALDDFGAGYGGFTYLKRLTVDYLKIDREFTRDLAGDRGNQHVVRAVVDLARGFGVRTVAEGVEDEATARLLRDMGVDLLQGYAIGRPGPLREVLGLGDRVWT